MPGNTYTKLLSFKGPDGTEMSVWSAPITAGGGTKPTVTVKPTGTAGIGFTVVEYSGLCRRQQRHRRRPDEDRKRHDRRGGSCRIRSDSLR